MEVVPLAVGQASRAWDEQHLDVTAAGGQIGGARTGGFTDAVVRHRLPVHHHLAAARGRPRARLAEARADGLRTAIADYLADRPCRRLRLLVLRGLPDGDPVTARSPSRRRRRLVPPLVVDPGAIRACAADLLAASAQVDDLGSFVAGDARIGDWTGARLDVLPRVHPPDRPHGRRDVAGAARVVPPRRRPRRHDAARSKDRPRTGSRSVRQHLLSRHRRR